jgi:chromosome segregation ATPase
VTRKNSKEETLKGAEDPHHSGPPSKETEEDTEALKQLCNAVQEQNSLPIVTECAEMESNVTWLVEDNSSTVQETARLKEAKKSVGSQSEGLKDEIGRLQKEVKENSATMMEHISSVIQQTESLKQEKEEMASEIQKLKADNERLCKRSMETKALRTERENMMHSIPEFKEKLSNAVWEKNHLQETIVNLTSEMEKLKAEQKMLLEGLWEREAIVTDFQNLKALEEELSNAIQETEHLKYTRETLESQIEELKHEVGRLYEKYKEISELDSEHYNMMQKLMSVVDQIECLNQVKVFMASEICRLNDEREMLREMNVEPTELRTECDKMKQKMTELVKKHRRAVEERDSLEEDTVKLMFEIEALQAEQGRLCGKDKATKALRTEYNYMKRSITKLEQELHLVLERKLFATDTKARQVEILNEINKEDIALRNACDDTKQRMTKLERELSVANEEMKCLKETKMRLILEFKELKEKQEQLCERKPRH